MKKYSEIIVALVWFLLLIGVAMFITSCGEPTKNMKINEGDSVVQCVVDSTWSSGSRSTIQPDNIYYFRTKCGNTHCANKSLYEVGDTITYVWKKTL